MTSRREKEPFIRKGDKVLMERAAPGGYWDVRAVRWASQDNQSDGRIELVLGRGSTCFKTVFNEKTMRHVTDAPSHVLSRDIRVSGPARIKRPR